ncbi:MAG: acyl-CoA reductase, partial [Chitinophagaceae bacterium]|nr:acyl-CoA reductase [Chitinophagaceae bacterium]
MNVEQRVELLERLRMYISSDDAGWNNAKEKAEMENPWFVPAFINYQLDHIASEYLDRKNLDALIRKYDIPADTPSPKNVGIVMAGNIPLAGFHDFLAVFLSGHHQVIKPSSKDFTLIAHIINKLKEWEPAAGKYFSLADQLKGCDAYIATGSNNSSRYFEYYFSRFPHIIRRNRTSAAILDGNETSTELEALADDVYLYFGLGCRNVTKLYVPTGYDFVPLLDAFKKYSWTFDIHKYKNNYDYQLAIMIINKMFYMTNGS